MPALYVSSVVRQNMRWLYCDAVFSKRNSRFASVHWTTIAELFEPPIPFRNGLNCNLVLRYVQSAFCAESKCVCELSSTMSHVSGSKHCLFVRLYA
jgi:hypothetical protein